MKKYEGKTSKIVAGLMGLILFAGSLAPSTSHAVVALSSKSYVGMDNWLNQTKWSTDDQQVVNAILCIALLPICLLDQKQDGSVNPSRAQLIENGYTNDEIAIIEKDQKKIASVLAERKMKLSVGPKDTSESIQAEIKSLHPEASSLYLDFVTESAGLESAE